MLVNNNDFGYGEEHKSGNNYCHAVGSYYDDDYGNNRIDGKDEDRNSDPKKDNGKYNYFGGNGTDNDQCNADSDDDGECGVDDDNDRCSDDEDNTLDSIKMVVMVRVIKMMRW